MQLQNTMDWKTVWILNKEIICRLIRSTAYELAGDRNQIYCRYVENTQNCALITRVKWKV